MALGPGMAHVATRFETTLSREGGRDLVYGGAMTMVLVHTPSGWKMLRGHTSSARRPE